MDQSDRRKRLIKFGSVLGGMMAFAIVFVMITGLLSGARQPVSGLPVDQPGGPAVTTSPDDPSPTATTTATPPARQINQPTPVATRTRVPSTGAEPRTTRAGVPTRSQYRQPPQQPRSTRPVERLKREPTAEPTTRPPTRRTTSPPVRPTTEPTAEPPPTAEPTRPDRRWPGRGDVPPGQDPTRTKGRWG
ncbi:hypothetical protein [Nonomuraea cypriaca]|uniref:hypothetical protein n=1 Tax=Nonomuraea cypriaca TaxID=1187855 RepID=UPI001A9C8B48|nr:hypothetical protein [Nonomuraea cypriaca]